MLASALGALSNRLDSSFLIGFWLPACVAVFGAVGIWTLGFGWDALATSLDGVDTITRVFLILAVLLAITLLACILRALARPLVAAFAGDLLPHGLRSWMCRQQVKKHRALQRRVEQGNVDNGDWKPLRNMARQVPHDEEAFQATRIGNLMEVAREHPRFAYAMDGLVWWPRLAPVAPAEFQSSLNGVQSPMMALLNLSVVFAGLALTAILAGLLAHVPWSWVFGLTVVGLLLANLCYRAAVSQAMELSTLLCVGFDLYRHEVLRRMDIAVPDSLEAERALWQSLTSEVLARRPHAERSAQPPPGA
jgi:hypothetical protein